MNRSPRLSSRTFSLTVLAVVAATLGACSSVPERHFALEGARVRLAAAQADPLVAQHASAELVQAAAAVQRANQAMADGKPKAEVEHLAYLGGQRVTLAEETAASRQAQSVVASARSEREAMLLSMRTQEADQAQRQLANAQQQGQRQGAELARADRDAAAARAQLDQAGRDVAAGKADLAQADRKVADSQAELARAGARAEGLEAQLKLLNARRTERGIVVTLGDMLFDTGQARVQGAGAASISRLAEFMRRNPSRRASVEGYTDSVGADAQNQALSARRAEAVVDALVGQGIGADRLRSEGFGEASPVAPNTTSAGRQSNRRVEIVFAPESGDMLTR